MLKKLNLKVVGVMELKVGERYSIAGGALSKGRHGFDIMIFWRRLMVQVTPGTDTAFEGHLYKMLLTT